MTHSVIKVPRDVRVIIYDMFNAIRADKLISIYISDVKEKNYIDNCIDDYMRGGSAFALCRRLASVLEEHVHG